ncbi:alpha/beta-hydrolase [Vararia minispora EC-137]|uniref:Alpha/beta-hydrolase n=1 Tax=Vararia minispora EC-137 TaxID=1314806 RepID=A0ACB8QTB6_9AGAM|nr:alpha/beta-hydrolase [Vararia minispora EC-137]
MLPASFLTFLAPLLARVFSPALEPPPEPVAFELRHIHAVTSDGRVFLSDTHLPPATQTQYADRPLLRTRKVKRRRPSSIDAVIKPRSSAGEFEESAEPGWGWDEDEVEAPDISSRATLHTLAKMTANAYYNDSGQGGWYELGANWTWHAPIGWEPDNDGFRGHIFASSDNSTVVLAIKGTSTAVFRGGGPTSRKDKLNDNLLFSCCCARVDWTWSTVCGCYRGGWKCDQSCLEDALIQESLFYPVGTNLYNNLTYMYPHANIWLAGHSLGGALASLLGVTFGAPTVAFEAPGERMAAQRLHLPMPPALQPVTHVYHTADPIAMGTCNGVLSSCAIAGYAMESRCHLGEVIEYDTVSNLSWGVDIRTHSIANVIDKVLGEPWLPAVALGREVPEPRLQDDCVECYSWEFGDFNSTGTAKTCR